MDAQAELLAEIEAFLVERRMAHTTFGLLAVKDGKLVARLRARANMTLGTITRVRAYLEAARLVPSEPKRARPSRARATQPERVSA